MKAYIVLALVFVVFAMAQVIPWWQQDFSHESFRYKIYILVFQAMSADEKKALKEKLGADCQAKEGASDDEMARLHKHEMPATKEGKCVIACVFETIGIVSFNSSHRTLGFRYHSTISFSFSRWVVAKPAWMVALQWPKNCIQVAIKPSKSLRKSMPTAMASAIQTAVTMHCCWALVSNRRWTLKDSHSMMRCEAWRAHGCFFFPRNWSFTLFIINYCLFVFLVWNKYLLFFYCI